MADISDVTALLASEVTAIVYPTGTSNPPVGGSAIAVMEGWPLPDDIDQMVAQYRAGVTQSLISIYPRGMFHNTSRYPTKWIEVSRPTKTITGAIDPSGTEVTLAGTVTPDQNVGLIVGYGNTHQAFVYTTSSSDTLQAVAAALAALVNAATPAISAGPVITIPAAYSMTFRVGVIGTIGRELRRQCERFDIHVWVPAPALRGTIGAPIRTAFGKVDFLTFSDGFAGRIQAGDDHWLDDPEKAGLWRRVMGFDIDYPTTESMPASEIIVFEASQAGGQTALGTAPVVNTFV